MQRTEGGGGGITKGGGHALPGVWKWSISYNSCLEPVFKTSGTKHPYKQTKKKPHGWCQALHYRRVYIQHTSLCKHRQDEDLIGKGGGGTPQKTINTGDVGAIPHNTKKATSRAWYEHTAIQQEVGRGELRFVTPVCIYSFSVLYIFLVYFDKLCKKKKKPSQCASRNTLPPPSISKLSLTVTS